MELFSRNHQHLANIFKQLLSKNPDARYNSAYGLKIDLLECQRRLLSAVSSSVPEHSSEVQYLSTNFGANLMFEQLISPFEIAMHDKFLVGLACLVSF